MGKEHSDCEARRGETNTAVGLQLEGPCSCTALLVARFLGETSDYNNLQIQFYRDLGQLKTHTPDGATHIAPSPSDFNQTAKVNSAASLGACREEQFL